MTGPAALPPLPHTWRPRLARIVTLLLAAFLIGFSVLVFKLLPRDAQDSFTWPQLLTLIAMLGAGALTLYVVSRGRITADADGLTVVNMLRSRRLEWAEVVLVRMRPGDPWVHLELADGSVLPATGIQASDGERGRRAAAELRAVAATMTRAGQDRPAP